MPNYHALTSALSFVGTNVVAVGATQGIGAGIALRFAELGASVLVVGRNETLGNNMVKTMEITSRQGGHSISGTARFGFVRRDLGSVEEIRGAAEDIARWAGDEHIHYLYMSQGGASAMAYPMTVQSMTTGFNVQVLSHFLLPYLLLLGPQPVLQKGAQICNIARPGEKDHTIDLDDFRSLKAIETGTFRLLPAAMKYCFVMDLFTKEFNVRFPDTHTTHVFPGHVATDMLANPNPNLPWFVRPIGIFLKYVVQPFTARSTTQYADIGIWETASEKAKSMKRTFWDDHGRSVDVDKRVETDVQLREAVWDNLLKLSEGGQ